MGVLEAIILAAVCFGGIGAASLVTLLVLAILNRNIDSSRSKILWNIFFAGLFGGGIFIIIVVLFSR